MKRIYLAALLALPLLALPARADTCANIGGCLVPFRIDWGCHFHAYGPADGLGQFGQLGPWYLYWPMEAHFQTPAPTGYPFWPAPMTLPPNAGMGGPAPANFMPASFQAPGYGASPPSYWGR
jgi:hypothetical protein